MYLSHHFFLPVALTLFTSMIAANPLALPHTSHSITTRNTHYSSDSPGCHIEYGLMGPEEGAVGTTDFIVRKEPGGKSTNMTLSFINLPKGTYHLELVFPLNYDNLYGDPDELNKLEWFTPWLGYIATTDVLVSGNKAPRVNTFWGVYSGDLLYGYGYRGEMSFRIAIAEEAERGMVSFTMDTVSGGEGQAGFRLAYGDSIVC